MKKILILIIFPLFAAQSIKAQESSRQFDTLQFQRLIEYANQLVEYEYVMQASMRNLKEVPDTSDILWYCQFINNTWHTVGGNFKNDKFAISKHFVVDSVYNVHEFPGSYDTVHLTSLGYAISQASEYFQQVLDTTAIYFNSFLINNTDKTISVWFLPAFQPSGQAIYGWEWEYIFDQTGKKLLKTNSYKGIFTGVWIGQPRELWLNYRNTDFPTIGSLYFGLTFCDFFTRLRIDTRISTSTISKDKSGEYFWSHKMK